MNKYEKRDLFTHEDYLATAANFPEEQNEYIVETAGFVPLEVKFKQFEQNGMIAQFQTGDFTSNDYRDIYLNPDFEINPEDEFEDVQEKLMQRNAFVEKLKAAKSTGKNEEAGTDEPEKKAADAAKDSESSKE